MNTVANSIDTNLTTKQILSFYSIAKDILKTLSTDKSNIVNIQQLYLQGQSAMIYDKRMRMTLYNYVPNTHSRDDITEAMKANLELIEHEDSKSFTFSINEPYEKKIVGEGPYKSTYVASKYPKAPDNDDDDSSSKKIHKQLLQNQVLMTIMKKIRMMMTKKKKILILILILNQMIKQMYLQKKLILQKKILQMVMMEGKVMEIQIAVIQQHLLVNKKTYSLTLNYMLFLF